MDALARRAAALLRRNDRGGYTVPAPHLYPHQWAWDSAFAAIGWLHVDPERAVRELETLLDGLWPDGRLPHIRFHVPSPDYFPGPEIWGTTDRTSLTQPPVQAIAARRLLEGGAPEDRVRALLPAIERTHVFFAAARDPLGWGAVAVVHPWESGLDNGPQWDRPLAAVDPGAAPPFRRVDKERVADPAERPTDDQYRRYVALVRAIAEDGFGPGPFAVYDPLTTAVLARAEADLAWLAAALGVPSEAAGRARRLRAGLERRLFDPALGRYRFYDVTGGEWLAPDVLAAYVPAMLDGLPGRDRIVEILRTRYWTPHPLPSTAPDDPAFDPRRYWRGPTWVNMNWLLAPVVGRDLVDRTLALVEREGFREYYHPETGEGLGARDFTWTAALVLDWLATLRDRS